MSGELLAIVDAQNRFIRWGDRAEVHGQRLPHRSVQVLVFDPAGRLIVQQRHAEKRTYPSCWDVSVAGHVEASDYPAGPDERLDEVYRSVAERELEEELGVRAPLEELGAFAPQADVHYEHFRLYRAISDGPFTLQAEEVQALRRVAPDEWEAFAAENPITRTLAELVRLARERQLWPAA